MDGILFMLETLQNTLNQIEVKGRDNIDRMLGSMHAIDQIKARVLETLNKEERKEPENG